MLHARHRGPASRYRQGQCLGCPRRSGAQSLLLHMPCFQGPLFELQRCRGLLRELNPGPLAPEARIMPLDQAANDDHCLDRDLTLCAGVGQLAKQLVTERQSVTVMHKPRQLLSAALWF